jgi:hypothetical protein
LRHPSTKAFFTALLFLTAAIPAQAGSATLAFSVLWGGDSWDYGLAIETDAAGNVWVVGSTVSSDFPFTTGSAPSEIFVARLSAAGELLSATAFGGALDSVHAAAQDASGNLYLAGSTRSPDFPATTSLAPPGAQQRVFVAKLDPAGRLVYATAFGGTGNQRITALAVDSTGRATVTGFTDSPDFPTASPLFPSLAGLYDAFVTRLAADGSGLVYSTYLGGSGSESPSGIAVDAAGNTHVAGSTTSTDFPRVRPLPEPISPGTSQAIVAKLSPDGSRLIYSVLLGGSASDLAEAVAIDPAGNAVVYGVTSSKDFPLRAALQPERASATDLEPWSFDTFLSRLSPDGALLTSTYLGASGEDRATAIAIDHAGFINLLGYTASPDFPLRDPLPIDIATPEFLYVGHLTRLDPQASEILFSTFLDGTEHTVEDVDGWANGMTVDAAGSLYVTGETDDFDFPIVGPSHRTLAEPTGDVFALKIDLNAPPGCSAATASPAVIWPPNGKLISVRIGGVTDPDGDPVTVSVTAVRQDEPLAKKGQPDATGLGTSRPMLRASRAGNGDGRVYHVTFTATDPQEASCTGTVTVCVPHDQRGRGCGDGGSLVDSTGGR